MPQIPSRLPTEYESPSPDHRTKYTGVVDTVLRYSNVLHLHQRFCHKVGDTMVRTSRFSILGCAAQQPKSAEEADFLTVNQHAPSEAPGSVEFHRTLRGKF